jgi:hypothetical protein
MNDSDFPLYLVQLFEQGELVCASNGLIGTRTTPVESLTAPTEFISVNSFRPGTTRSDENVAVFRNFLIEIDDMSLEDQERYIEKELGLPFTTKTFSGGKSYHYVVSLAEPLASLEEFREVAQWLLDVVDKADTKCRNPSRFTRMAGGRRTDKGTAQPLVQLNRRITPEELGAFFKRHHAKLEAADAERKRRTENVELAQDVTGLPEDFRGRLSLRTKKFVREHAVVQGRNNELHFAACDYKNNLFTLAEAFEQLVPAAQAVGLSAFEARNTIRSAYQKAPLRPRLA